MYIIHQQYLVLNFVVVRFENIHPTWVIAEDRKGIAKGQGGLREAICDFNKVY